MATNDRLRQVRDDVALAVLLLSRLPVPYRVEDTGRTAAAAWAWPLVGLLVGGLASGAAWLALNLGLPAPMAAGVALAALIMATGALHEDGLADSADGLWGGQTAERRLEIMRDSRIGSYGVLALGVTLLMRWSALTALIGAEAWLVLPAAAMLSRAAMAVLMGNAPFARADGLSHSTGQPPTRSVAVAVAVAIVAAVLLSGSASLIAALAAAAATWSTGSLAQARIGGQTGDILGAAQQVSEIAALAVFVAALA